MHFGFAGSPRFAADILQCILDAGLRPQLVITQAAKPTGRGQKLQYTPVYTLAEHENIPIASPNKISACAHLLSELEFLIVAAYGQILPQSILDIPRLGCINVHASLLPRWRGASPIEHAILNGDTTTGISVMHIERKLDAGPVYLTQHVTLNGTETTASLSQNLAKIGGSALLKVLNNFFADEAPKPVPQATTGVSYAPQLTSKDACINWEDTAVFNERKVRAFVGRSSAYTTCRDLRLRILEAAVHTGEFIPGRLYRTEKTVVMGCQQDGLRLETVQLNRGKGTPLNITAALNGFGRFFKDGIQFD